MTVTMKRWLLIVCLASTFHVAEAQTSTQKDRGVVLSRAELDNILREHKRWVWTQGIDGRRADLSNADLSSADLVAVELSGADLEGAHLTQANLTGAHLSHARLTGAYLTGARLSGATLTDAELSGAHLTGADLSNAVLTGADLSSANLTGTNLSGTDFSGTDLKGAIYEPAVNPDPPKIARAQSLEDLRWQENPASVVALRKSFQADGFEQQERKVHLAIRRGRQNLLERVLFDWTCQWGTNSSRPLELIGLLSVLCTFVYWIGIHFQGKSGLYLVATGLRIATSKGKERVCRIVISPLRYAPRAKTEMKLHPRWRRFGLSLRPLGTALLFSLMSSFNIGFQGFNLGRWIRMLQPREFDIRATGWMRTVSGIQSLLGLALVALSLLSYFDHPFE